MGCSVLENDIFWIQGMLSLNPAHSRCTSLDTSEPGPEVCKYDDEAMSFMPILVLVAAGDSLEELRFITEPEDT